MSDQPIEFLIDNGSTSSIISNKVYQKIPDNIRPALKTVQTVVHDASGNKIKTFGTVDVKLVLAGHEFEQRVTVCEISQDGIIGQDFLLKYANTINYKQGIIQTIYNEIPCYVGNKSESTCSIVVRRTTIIPSNSAAWLPVDILGCERLNKYGLVEPTLIGEGTCTIIPGIVNTTVSDTVVNIVNCSEVPITLHAKQSVGVCESYEDNETSSERVAATTVLAESNEIPDHLKELFAKSSIHLDENETSQLASLLIEYQGVFAKDSSDLGQCNRVQHKIHTGNAIPVRQPARRQPLAKRDAEREEVQKMLDRGVIEPSRSPWSSPVVLVTKRDNSIRFCVDYRVLNELTVKDAYPIPRVDDCLDALSGSKWYSTMDLSSGFWQVGLAEEDREKSAFATSLGLFQWTVMPFGLVNSPSTFERLMEDVLRGLQWIELLIYMDDIISPSQTIEQGLSRLRTIFDRLLQANLKLKPSKCVFFQKQTTFLGHVVSEAGIATDPAKIEAVKDWPVPRTPKQMKSFLGLCSYYRRFVEGFAKIARPLHKICEKSAHFIWSDECQEAFDTLKTALTSSPVLAYPEPGKEYILDTDASQKAVGAVLSQVSNGHERVIAYMSQSMNVHEQSYCTTRKELLAVVCGLRKFHSYLYGQSIRLRTDNAAVSWLRSLKQPTGQVARWIQEIETYTLTVEHRAGLKHSNADALSRLPCRVCERQEKLNTELESDSDCEEVPLLLRPTVTSPKDIQNGFETVVRATNVASSSKVTHTFLDGWSPTEIRQSQLQDQNISPLMTALETGNDRPRWDIVSPGMSFLKTLWRQWDRLFLIDGMLHLTMVDTDLNKDKYLLVVPNSRRTMVLHYFHDIPSAGHLGSDKTLFRVKQSFYWPGMKSDT